MANPQSLKVHQAVARAVFENGLDIMFGLMGDANMFMVDAFIRDCGGRYIAAANEAGAAFMSLGYAAVAGRPGICTVTHGPAMVNTLTALTHGVRASLPMVLLCGDTHIEDRGHTQNVAQREYIVATGAGFEQLRSARTVAEDVAIVLRRAITERRPIALNLPHELDWLAVDEFHPIRVHIPETRALVNASNDLDNAVGIIAAAKKPMIIAGRGARSPEVKRAILKLADRIGAPLATTLKAKDLFLNEAYDLGICGTVSTPGTVETVMESDCIIAFGASLHGKTLSNGTFAKAKRIIQVNLEPGEIAKNFEPDAGLVGDPAGVADLIMHWLNEADIPSSGFRNDEMQKRIAADKAAGSTPLTDEKAYYHAILEKLDRILPADRTLVTDVGRFMLEVWNKIRVRDPRHFVSTNDFGSIGLSSSFGIGASFAAPGQPVVVFCGDGGFMHGGLVEFSTAVRHNVDLIVVVCNDGCYGAEQMTFAKKQKDPGSIFIDWPDFAPLADALGGHGVTVRSDSDWAVAEKAITSRTKPLLLDVKLDPQRMPLY